MKPENIAKLSDDSMIKKRKSRESAGRKEEKRGSSTIYVPKSTASKLGMMKSSEKTTHQTSRDKKKLQDSSVSRQRISSRERRKSRTLSPSEIKMLHSAVKRSEKAEQTKKNVSMNDQDAQMDSDYDYEDDFEVEKRKQES